MQPMATRAPSKRSASRAGPHPPGGKSAATSSEQTPPESIVTPVRVAGIGASAGGLEAFIDLVSAMPVDTGLALVLIQHLDPRHHSMLVDILAGATAIPVREVVDGMRIERDHIYVIPPDTEMTIQNHVLRLAPRTQKVPPRTLDTFFFSLAQDRGNSSIGVVLSGNDADGTRGLQAIHDAGGTTFAQSPES